MAEIAGEPIILEEKVAQRLQAKPEALWNGEPVTYGTPLYDQVRATLTDEVLDKAYAIGGRMASLRYTPQQIADQINDATQGFDPFAAEMFGKAVAFGKDTASNAIKLGDNVRLRGGEGVFKDREVTDKDIEATKSEYGKKMSDAEAKELIHASARAATAYMVDEGKTDLSKDELTTLQDQIAKDHNIKDGAVKYAVGKTGNICGRLVGVGAAAAWTGITGVGYFVAKGFNAVTQHHYRSSLKEAMEQAAARGDVDAVKNAQEAIKDSKGHNGIIAAITAGVGDIALVGGGGVIGHKFGNLVAHAIPIGMSAQEAKGRLGVVNATLLDTVTKARDNLQVKDGQEAPDAAKDVQQAQAAAALPSATPVYGTATGQAAPASGSTASQPAPAPASATTATPSAASTPVVPASTLPPNLWGPVLVEMQQPGTTSNEADLKNKTDLAIKIAGSAPVLKLDGLAAYPSAVIPADGMSEQTINQQRDTICKYFGLKAEEHSVTQVDGKWVISGVTGEMANAALIAEKQQGQTAGAQQAQKHGLSHVQIIPAHPETVDPSIPYLVNAHGQIISSLSHALNNGQQPVADSRQDNGRVDLTPAAIAAMPRLILPGGAPPSGEDRVSPGQTPQTKQLIAARAGDVPGFN